jgi:fatty acid photodecarboxylase
VGGEVVLTGGALASPQLLMISGIGPAEHLRSLSIPVVYDNPNVGENLQDHPAAVVSFSTPQKGISITSKLRMFGFPNPLPILKWILFKTGVATTVGCDHGAFVKTTLSATQADLQIRFIAARALDPDGMKSYIMWRHTTTHMDGYTLQSVAIRAKSKGRVRLASSNSHVKPMIDGGYLSNPDDLATLREGIKLGRELGNRPEWGEHLGEEIFPGISVQSDNEIEEYIKNTVHTANALVGTCKMGVGLDSVVDPDLKVLGVKGLRVADASIIPIIPGGQTGTPTVMIAVRAAEMLLNSSSEVIVEVFQNQLESIAAEAS